MKKFIMALVLVLIVGSLIMINTSEAFSKWNCTAAKLHKKGKLTKGALLLTPDYQSRSAISRLIIQQVCVIKY